ncbi:hypothetical protein GmHk_07G019597 [Glycine max]|nr:hypothetical protein GmHk_07G019597 [Glycine max]
MGWTSLILAYAVSFIHETKIPFLFTRLLLPARSVTNDGVECRRTTFLLSLFLTWFKSDEVTTVPPHIFLRGSSSFALFRCFPKRSHSLRVSIQEGYKL